MLPKVARPSKERVQAHRKRVAEGAAKAPQRPRKTLDSATAKADIARLLTAPDLGAAIAALPEPTPHALRNFRVSIANLARLRALALQAPDKNETDCLNEILEAGFRAQEQK